MTTNAPNSHLPAIAALSSGGGMNAIAMIRLSGHGCHDLLKKLIKPTYQSDREFPARRLVLCQFNDLKTKETIDEPLVSFFYDSHSFTGEPAAEIHCHGGQYIVSQILQNLYQAGFIEARPGEFSHRAFLNDKMDLTQAEGINDLIHAQTHSQWNAARHLASGKLAKHIESLRENIIAALALLEARIDFPDEEEASLVGLHLVLEKTAAVDQEIKSLMASYSGGQVAAHGLSVCLVGEPNAGKSTLMNTLLEKDRAIVTKIAGTTRDYLEEACLINGRLVRLIDTAGMRDTTDEVESLGVEKAKELAQNADLVLLLCSADSSADAVEKLEIISKNLGHEKFLSILTKADLGQPPWASNFLPISCQKQTGIHELKAHLSKSVDKYVAPLSDSIFISNQRHFRALEQAHKSLITFFDAAKNKNYDECLAFELQQVNHALTSVIGHVGSDDLFDKIFGDFCIGK